MGHIKPKGAVEHVQNAQIQIILHTHKIFALYWNIL